MPVRVPGGTLCPIRYGVGAVAVALFDTETPLAPLRERILAKVTEVISEGRFILGPEVEAFERELAAYVGVRHAIGVANGTDALTIAARSVGVKRGDDVIVPSFTFYATAEAIASLGANPVFCDVDPGTRNITPDTVEAALTPATTAVVAVDQFGGPADCAPIRERVGLPVIEDAAQALGAAFGGTQAGGLGDVGTISFYPSKNLGAFGDGGAIVTDDPEVAVRARALRFHGSSDKQSFEFVGYNSRLDELQAAILRLLLPQLDGWCDGRRRAAQHYAAAGIAEHVTPPLAPARVTPAWHLYVVTHPQPEALIARLGAAGVQARSYYRTPLHRQPAMAPYVKTGLELSVTEELAASNLALPMSPALSAEQVAEVVAALAPA
jgi:dTDP-3-amino-3,4,6-trideoxy-alpha-D-glucose transaminase